ncbi:MAG: deoxyribonuclease, partial [Anaerolineaceae bacterium]|nr:deoxyribonuclease [Anaerolineaceae bacterium]
SAAEAEVAWLETDPTNTGASNIVLIGDFNSYDKEDPIDIIKAGADGIDETSDDYLDMVFEIQGDAAYGYVYDAQVGYLDYALANSSMAQYIVDVNFWHINADEPDIIDYDMTYKADAQDLLYAPDAYRSSDHDPVVITLSFPSMMDYSFPVFFH